MAVLTFSLEWTFTTRSATPCFERATLGIVLTLRSGDSSAKLLVTLD